MIIDPKKKEAYSQPMNCCDNYVIWQRINFQGVNPDEKEYPWGLPYKTVGRFKLCVRRYSSINALPACKTCKKEIEEWRNYIRGDRKYSDMVGGFSTWINRQLVTRNTQFLITPIDIIVNGKTEQKEELP